MHHDANTTQSRTEIPTPVSDFLRQTPFSSEAMEHMKAILPKISIDRGTREAMAGAMKIPFQNETTDAMRQVSESFSSIQVNMKNMALRMQSFGDASIHLERDLADMNRYMHDYIEEGHQAIHTPPYRVGFLKDHF